MLENGYLPEITTINKKSDDETSTSLYSDFIHKVLGYVVSSDFFKQANFDGELPIFKSKFYPTKPGNLTFYILGKHQKHVLKFAMEMLSNWLVPGRRLNLSGVFSSEFVIPSQKSQTYIACELILQVDSEVDLEQVKINLPIIETEIVLGMESSYYAKRILEVKGLTPDAKSTLIQEKIAHLLKRLPEHFDFNLLTEMQHILVICRDEFKSQRSSQHLTRIIGIQYLFRRFLSPKQQVPNKRRLFLKIFRSNFPVQHQKKHVLGIIVGFNFLRDKEVFEKRHLIRAIQNHIPHTMMVENSFFEDRRSLENFCTLYLEIEKSNGSKFTNQEIITLRKTLPEDLLDGIEQLVHSVFMPRNEEEIMRNILSLSTEVKYLRDLPQVMINFDEQTYSKLSFTIIIVRMLRPGDDSVEDLFKKNKTSLEYVHDRCKTIGYLRNKHTKEATVFSVKIEKDEFIRRDQSIDINKARQAIVSELLRVLGEFRDFNGGMISKQNELLSEVKSLMVGEKNFNDWLFENFFFSITPIVIRAVLEPRALKTWFLMLQKAIETPFDENTQHFVDIITQPSYVFTMVKSEHKLSLETMVRALNVLQAKSSDIAMAGIQVHDVNYNGFIFRCMDASRQQQFETIIRQNAVFRNESKNEYMQQKTE